MSNRFWTALLIGAAATAAGAQQAPTLDRTTLPIQEPSYPPVTEVDARNAKAPARFEVKAPQGAPNVLIVLIDDMGFGMSSAFGGPIHMPTLERLAAGGLKYNRFHTTALCSPTRTALLSGRNHHMNNMGVITEMATAFPGYTGQRPASVAPLAEMLRLNGYSTAFFGKNHETAAWEVSPSGPTDRWPTRSGFDRFYGFIGGETNQWAPFLYDGTTPVEIPNDPHYHFTVDMTNQAIAWTRYQKSLTPDKPFFVYYAPGATHAPHHVPKSWADKYKGKFDQGWDKLREETLARQIALGVVPAGTKLAAKPGDIKDWATLSADEKKLFARQMEVYAGFGEQTDFEIGRLIDAIAEMGQLDDTLVFYIVGDNGTSAEGTQNGLFNEYTYFNGIPETVADQLKHLDGWGGPMTYPHMAMGWAVAGDTPFMWTKQVASNFGGTRNGLVVRWPKGIKAKNELRTQFHHVIDVAPTVLEAAHLPEPTSVNGTKQVPIQGVSMVYSFEDGKAKERHTRQYFEMLGNRAIYADGWFAAVVHKLPWAKDPIRPLAQDVWELYDTRADFSLANDLAAKEPEKLKAMQAIFLDEAKRNHVKNRSYAITADLSLPTSDANGVILCQGGRFGGWALYMRGGKLAFTYNYLGLEHFDVLASKAAPAGKASVRYEFAYDGGGFGKGGTSTLYVNGDKVAEAKFPHTQPFAFSADETADVGIDDATPVVEEMGSGLRSRFSGTIEKVTVTLK
jgi:arylsulfatase A-like enzyme